MRQEKIIVTWVVIFFEEYYGTIQQKIYTDGEFMVEDVKRLRCYNGVQLLHLYELKVTKPASDRMLGVKYEQRELTLPSF